MKFYIDIAYNKDYSGFNRCVQYTGGSIKGNVVFYDMNDLFHNKNGFAVFEEYTGERLFYLYGNKCELSFKSGKEWRKYLKLLVFL